VLRCFDALLADIQPECRDLAREASV
jgi:hypothetical protein